MVIFPKDNPVIEQLSSYYVDIKRLLEHYQGELVSGAFHFKSASSEGALFFDNNSILNGIFVHKEEKIIGVTAVDRIINGCKEINFTVGVYEIDSSKIIFWANILSANRIYQNLSTEFTDLQGLIKKMSKERLTGYIEVLIVEMNENAWVLFYNGSIIGGVFSWGNAGIDGSKQNLIKLIEDTKKANGIFHVSKVAMAQNATQAYSVLNHLEQLLLSLAEKLKPMVKSDAEFELLLKQKLVANADRFTFLDPFAGEFTYSGRKISYNGDAGNKDLVKGITATALQIAMDYGILDTFKNEMVQFLQKHGHGLKMDGLNS